MIIDQWIIADIVSIVGFKIKKLNPSSILWVNYKFWDHKEQLVPNHSKDKYNVVFSQFLYEIQMNHPLLRDQKELRWIICFAKVESILILESPWFTPPQRCWSQKSIYDRHALKNKVWLWEKSLRGVQKQNWVIHWIFFLINSWSITSPIIHYFDQYTLDEILWEHAFRIRYINRPLFLINLSFPARH